MGYLDATPPPPHPRASPTGVLANGLVPRRVLHQLKENSWNRRASSALEQQQAFSILFSMGNLVSFCFGSFSNLNTPTILQAPSLTSPPPRRRGACALKWERCPAHHLGCGSFATESTDPWRGGRRRMIFGRKKDGMSRNMGASPCNAGNQ